MGPAHQRLHPFVGRWQTAGHQYESPFCDPASFTAVETYEWLSGGLFLIHRLDGRMGNDLMSCIEIVDFDRDLARYNWRSFYGDGGHHAWHAVQQDAAMVLLGSWPSGDDGQPIEIRAAFTFTDDGNTLLGRWEYRAERGDWITYFESRATRH